MPPNNTSRAARQMLEGARRIAEARAPKPCQCDLCPDDCVAEQDDDTPALLCVECAQRGWHEECHANG